MISKPMDVLHCFPVRKSKTQKQSFRDAAQSYLNSIGYESIIKEGRMGVRNIVVGNPETARYLVTAHYDTPAALYALLALMLFGPANKSNADDNTSGVVTVLEIAKSLPESYRDQVCFVLFDLEEAGLIGSRSYQKAHKKHTANQLVLNMDCVDDGNEIMLFPTKNLLNDPSKMDQLWKISGSWGEKSIAIREKGFAYYPSDQKHFPYGVGIAAFNRNNWAGLYCSRIHTKKDTVLEETNVNILRAAIVSLITCSAVK